MPSLIVKLKCPIVCPTQGSPTTKSRFQPPEHDWPVLSRNPATADRYSGETSVRDLKAAFTKLEEEHGKLRREYVKLNEEHININRDLKDIMAELQKTKTELHDLKTLSTEFIQRLTKFGQDEMARKST
ncbi:hypothetical protein BJX63DRAFT_438772 [Aspergillus granulosus]|uniref:Uncharacterized protein n=1 Tax=Aspergillus granulosus TaxID=176169 RepID=A0ABR4GR18_9EURO